MKTLCVGPSFRGPAARERDGLPAKVVEKAAGFRYVYLYVEHRGRVYLMLLFAKNEQVELTSEQRRHLHELTIRIKKGKG